MKKIKKSPIRLLALVLLSLLINLPLIRQFEASAGVNYPAYLPGLFENYNGPIVTTLQPSSTIFGVQMYGDTGPTNPYHAYLMGSQAGWLRVNVQWDRVEPTNTTPDNFDWSVVDKNLAAAIPENGSLEIIATIERNPSWASPDLDGVIDNEDINEFVEFMVALVERYDGDGVDDAPFSPIVNHWEIYNEPDRAASPSRWGNDGDKYAQMLAAIYPAMKNANPNAQVVFGGIAFDWFIEDGGPFNRDFLDDVLAAGGGPYIDIMNFHSYPSFAINWTGVPDSTGVIAKSGAIRDIMSSHSVDMPIVITEAGHHSNAAVGVPSTEELQARYIVTIYTESIVADIQSMIWWMLYDIGDFYPFDNGLVTNGDSNPIQEKVSYSVYQNAFETLGHLEFVRTLTANEVQSSDASVHLFEDPINNKLIYVLWRTEVPNDNYITVKIPETSAIVRDSITNSTVSVVDSDDGMSDSRLSLQINGRPVYVEVDQ